MPGYTPEQLSTVLEAKGVKFEFVTAGVKYQAVIHKDRTAYEKAQAEAGFAGSSRSSSTSSESGSSAKAVK